MADFLYKLGLGQDNLWGYGGKKSEESRGSIVSEDSWHCVGLRYRGNVAVTGLQMTGFGPLRSLMAACIAAISVHTESSADQRLSLQMDQKANETQTGTE